MKEWQVKTQRSITDILTNWTNCELILEKEMTPEQWMNIFKKLNDRLGHKKNSPRGFNEQIASTLSLLKEIVESNDVHLIPAHLVNDLDDRLASLKRQVRAFYNFCQSFLNRDKKIGYSIDNNIVLSFESKIKGGTHVWNLVDEFEEILDRVNGLLNTHSFIINMIKGKGIQRIDAYEKEWEKRLTQVADMQSHMDTEYKIRKPLYEEITQWHNQTIKESKEIKKGYKELQHLLSEVAQFSSTFANDKAVIEERKADITAISDSAEKLRAKINSHESELEEADKISLKRDEEQKKLEADMNDTLEELKAHEQNAKNILHLSTSGGLAKNFRARERIITHQLRIAYWLNLVALVGFAIYAIISFFKLGGTFNPESPDLGVLFFKFSLLLPIIPILTFTNKRYKELFKLKENYAYKDSIAVSVPSFKDQSGDYGSLVATTLFSKLTSNPADDIGRKKGKSDYIEEPESLYKAAIDAIKNKIANKDKLLYKDTFEAIEKEIDIIEELINDDDTTSQNSIDAIKKEIAKKTKPE